MNAALSAYTKGLRELQNYIDRLGLVESLVEEISALDTSVTPTAAELKQRVENVRSHKLSRGQLRQFTYSSIIISLYGYFEYFLEELMRSYLRDLNKIITPYSKLPRDVLSNHIELSFKLIQRLALSKYVNKYSSEGIIANLHSCSTGATSYLLNEEAFTIHEANFRPGSIDSFFRRVGIKSIFARACKHTDFQKYLESDGLLESDIRSTVEDLAERRNEVSHGIPSALLANTELLKYIEQLEELGKGLCEIVFRETLPFRIAQQGVALGKPLKVFDNRIVAFRVEKITFQKGDLLISHRADNPIPYLGGAIEEIQVNHKKYPSYTVDASDDIALRVGFKCKENHNFYLVSPDQRGVG